MYRNLLVWICLLLAPVGTAIAGANEPAAKETGMKQSATKKSTTKKSISKKSTGKESTGKESTAKELSGMSVIGNDEAPKALYIVPWKGSEMGVETNLNMMLNPNDAPVDRDVFMRQLDFYEVSTGKK